MLTNQNPIIKEISNAIKLPEYIFAVLSTHQCFTCSLYNIENKEIIYNNEETKRLFDLLHEKITVDDTGKCIFMMYKQDNDSEVMVDYVSFYNRELYDEDAFELLIYQKYGFEPVDDDRKEQLKDSIKQEKIKKTLVYACYENDIKEILARLIKVSKKQLNYVYMLEGTPLGIVAKHNNLKAFEAIYNAGADINKKSIASTPLEIAFESSPEIVRFIYKNAREQFDKEVNKRGFAIAIRTKDEGILDLILANGADINGTDKSFPNLHNCADENNVEGLSYLIKHGADIHLENKYKQTALDRAERLENTEAINFLKKYM